MNIVPCCYSFYLLFFNLIQLSRSDKNNSGIWNTSTSLSAWPSSCFGCNIYVGTVQVLYFPETNATISPSNHVVAVSNNYTLYVPRNLLYIMVMSIDIDKVHHRPYMWLSPHLPPDIVMHRTHPSVLRP